MDKGITPGADLSVALNVYYVSAIRDASPTGALMEKTWYVLWKNLFTLLSNIIVQLLSYNQKNWLKQISEIQVQCITKLM